MCVVDQIDKILFAVAHNKTFLSRTAQVLSSQGSEQVDVEKKPWHVKDGARTSTSNTIVTNHDILLLLL